MNEHCERLAAGNRWPTAPAGSVFASRTDAFDVSISVFAQGEQAPSPLLGEEVATVLDGSFHVDAAGESYDLVKGEAIIIPPGEPRSWTCQDKRGVLYRAIVTKPAAIDS